jgi:hypothetical protein
MVYGSMGTMLLYHKHMNLYSTNTNVYLAHIGLFVCLACFKELEENDHVQGAKGRG